MEKNGVYNKNRELVRYTIRDSEETLNENEYTLITVVWVFNSKKELLMQRRSMNKSTYPGIYTNHGGASIYGETSIESALRELKEEVGIEAEEHSLTLINSFIENQNIFDEYIMHKDIEIDELSIDCVEVDCCVWMSIDQIRSGIEKGSVFNYHSNGNRFETIIVPYLISQKVKM